LYSTILIVSCFGETIFISIEKSIEKKATTKKELS